MKNWTMNILFYIFDFMYQFLKNLIRFFFPSWKKIIFVGLDNSGKTTLLHLLQSDRLTIHPPTYYPQKMEFKFEGVSYEVDDLGGVEGPCRKYWKDYFSVKGLQGIVFMVDLSDPERFDEAKTALQEIFKCQEIQHLPVLVLGNKLDMVQRQFYDSKSSVTTTASSWEEYKEIFETEMRSRLGLDFVPPPTMLPSDTSSDTSSSPSSSSSQHSQPVQFFLGSCVLRVGYREGLRWLTQSMRSNR